MWKEYDCFFYSNLDIADKCGFITVLNGKAIGHISWDRSGDSKSRYSGRRQLRCKPWLKRRYHQNVQPLQSPDASRRYDTNRGDHRIRVRL